MLSEMKSLVLLGLFLCTLHSAASAQEESAEEQAPLSSERRAELTQLVRELDTVASDGLQVIERSRALLLLLGETPDAQLEAGVRARIGEALYRTGEFEEAIVQLDSAIALAREHGEQNLLLQSLGNLALIHHLRGNTAETLELGQECLALSEELNQFQSTWRIASILGAEHGRLGEYKQALDYYSWALDISTNAGDEKGISSLLNNICVLHLQYGDRSAAEEFLELSEASSARLGDPRTKATVLITRGNLHLSLGNVAEALACHFESLGLEQSAGNEKGLATAHHSIGLVYLSTGEFELALEHLLHALEIEERLQLLPDVVTTLGYISEAYAALEQIELATQFSNQSSELSAILDIKMDRLRTLHSLTNTRELLGDFEGALAAKKEASALMSEHNELDRQREFAKFKAEFELNAKERELVLLRSENALRQLELDHERLVRNSSIAGAILIALLGLLGWNRFLVKRAALTRLARAQDELSGLNADLEHHSAQLEEALSQIHVLQGLLPICAHCKSIRDETGDWHKLETYITGHSPVSFTHGICPPCLETHYPESLVKR